MVNPVTHCKVPRINPLALDRRFSAEIRVLTGFHAYLQKRFICKTRTGRPLVSAIRFWNLRLLKSHWSCMAAKSGLIQVGLVCESPKAQQINQRFTVDRRTPISQTFALIAGDCNTTASQPPPPPPPPPRRRARRAALWRQLALGVHAAMYACAAC